MHKLTGAPRRNTHELTGVEKDHGFEADVLLLLQLQLSEPGGGSQQHVEDFHEALNTAPLLSAQRKHTHRQAQNISTLMSTLSIPVCHAGITKGSGECTEQAHTFD